MFKMTRCKRNVRLESISKKDLPEHSTWIRQNSVARNKATSF
ncbi:hypothetical protein RRSWK_06859 [Rhodopirellula sp. SWK7]|nr:hypothetical protein RRSWK_06859 [Rhodopirellula sp. SWK7]